MGHLEQTAADKSALGFEYQDLVLVNILLGLKPGEKIGLEVFDDLHTENVTNELCLIQVKHSLNGGNITERDIDLWKTLYNWLKSLPELPVREKITFQIYSNKSLGNQDLIVLLKSAASNKDKIIEAFQKILFDLNAKESLKDKDDSKNPILKYVEALAIAKKEQLFFILDRFQFHTDTGSLTQQINDHLLYLAVPISKLHDTRKFVLGAYKEYKISSILSGNKVIITYDIFRVNMGFDRILRSSRSDEIDYDRFYDKYYSFKQMGNLSFLNSTFSNQLKDIGLPPQDIIDHGIEMLATADLIEDLKKEGDFTYQDEFRLTTQCDMSWKKIHSEAHDCSNKNYSEPLLAAKACYETTLEKELKLKNIALPDGFSKGKFIALSDIPSIGWKLDWKELYSK
jgi:hypothetical protein